MDSIKLKKQCKTCEFNFDGICAGGGDLYEYGSQIIDDSQLCDAWSADLDYYTYETTTAPRFLREQLNDCSISYAKFSTMYDKYFQGEAIPINIFDAVKFIYGISMVDIAVLMDVTFGVVYRAKSCGIPAKRLSQFSDVLGLSQDLLMSITTGDFAKLQESKDKFWAQPNIQSRLNSMPRWKENLAYEISSFYLHCPLHLARDFARIDKFYWSSSMNIDNFTDSEKNMIGFLTRKSKKHKPALEIDYSLDIACNPHMRTTYNRTR